MARSLVDEFCAEAADLLDGVDASVLALERGTAGGADVHELFRRLHTLKGASAIFPVDPFTAIVHAAEDVVAAIRSGGLDPAPALVDDLLAATDQLRSWLVPIHATGRLAADPAEVAGLARRLRRWTGVPATPAGHLEEATTAAARAWLRVLPPVELRRCREWLERTGARVRLLRYQPAPDAFFRGEDPVALLRGVPAVDVAGAAVAGGPGSEEGGDEGFDCALTLVAVTRAERAEIAVALAATAGSVSVAEMGAADLVPGGGDDPAGIARQLLEAQLEVLSRPVPEAQRPACYRAAARAAAGALRLLDPAPGAGDRLAAAVEAAVAAGDGRLLAGHLEAALAGVAGDPGDPGVHSVPGGPGGPGGGARPAPAPAPAIAPVPHLRVERATVDRLLRHTGELVASTNALAHLARQAEEGGHARLARELRARGAAGRRVVDDLRAAVLDLRMVPLEATFDRFLRPVRDLARGSAKRIRLERHGADVRADAGVVEVLADALLHLVRNAADHGIEPPEQRRAAGKPEEGTISLRAAEDADGLTVEVADDGRGMDTDGLRRRAAAAGAISGGDADRLTPDAAAALAFLPGVSTAGGVSQLSGRGVGLDAVRAAVAEARGSVTVESRPGQGTTVRIHLPRSISVTDALVVRSGGQRFAVPVDHVRRTARIPLARRHVFAGAVMADLLGGPVALRSLGDLLGLDTGFDDAVEGGSGAGAVLALVVDTGEGAVALAVDAIEGRDEVLVQPLDGIATGHPGVLGTSMRADGSVLVVLDARRVCRAG